MFWQSVGAGITSLLDWHILVGIVAVGTTSVVYHVVVGLTVGEGQSVARVGTGMSLIVVGGPLIQALSVSAFILLCLPAVIGGQGFTPANAVGPLFWPVFKEGLLAMLMVLLLFFIPIVGPSISGTPGAPTFLQGVFMLKPISKQLYYVISDGTRLPDSAFPSFWNCLGYVGIGVVLCRVGLICVLLLAEQVQKRRNPIRHMLAQYRSEPSGGMMILGMFIGPAIGIVPLLMYGRYVGFSIHPSP